jgi:hypothetical protein
VHRVAQFVAHVTARVRPEEEALARGLLPAGARQLFAGMPVADRRHALDVLARLLHAGGYDSASGATDARPRLRVYPGGRGQGEQATGRSQGGCAGRRPKLVAGWAFCR